MSNIPSIEPYLYEGSSIPDVINHYLVALQEDSSVESLLVAAKLQEVLSMISDADFLTEIRSIFDELYDAILVNLPELFFCLEGRRKSLLRTVAKIYSLIDRKRSLDDIRDVYAFRLTLLDTDPWDQVKNCYLLMNRLIPFFIKKGFIPCEAEPLSGTEGFSVEKMPSVAVPTLQLLDSTYETVVKDYVRTPKDNGYQSLHVALRDSKSGRCFEIQVRSFSMHVHAESGEACHKVYETQKYEAIPFDPTRIVMRGFQIGPDGTIYDAIGLSQSLNIIARQKTLPRET